MLHCQICKINLSYLLRDFNIHVDNTNDELGLAFTDLINSFGVKQNITRPGVCVLALCLRLFMCVCVCVCVCLLGVSGCVCVCVRRRHDFVYIYIKSFSTHHFNHTLDLIILHGIDLTDIDIVPQSDDVTEHFLVSCMLHITDINYMAPR